MATLTPCIYQSQLTPLTSSSCRQPPYTLGFWEELC